MSESNSQTERDDPQLRQILDSAVDLPIDQREAFLTEACGADGKLRAQIESLLNALDQANGFLANPTVGGASDVPREGPGSRIGPYKLLQKIGEGGMGVVYMAEQERPVVRRVAIKIIKLGMDTRQVIARFEAERQALALMDHPNIARVLDAGATDTGRPYFVMELVRGVSITEYCDTNNLSTRQRLELFLPVCRAVQHAHQKGIIHRDIKPSNVLITMHDGVPVPKVIDFGVAKATSGRLTDKTLFTEYHHFIGTPEYMSPEQAEMSGLDIDTRADVYALGVLLYELLTGTTPFDAKSLRRAAYAEIQRIIREVEPPKPSTRLSTLGETLTKVAAQRGTDGKKLGSLMRGDLDWIVMRCLEKDRTRRYETANAVAMDVQRYLKDEPVEASPPSATYKFRKLARKYKKEVSALVAIVSLLVLGIFGTSIGMIRSRALLSRTQSAEKAATEQKNDANKAKDRAERQAERANAVSKFMVSMLQSARPGTNYRAADTRVMDMLEAAAKSVDRRLQSQPEAEVEVRGTLGKTYLTLGMWEEAQNQLKRAYDLTCAAQGGESEQSLRITPDLIYATAKIHPQEAESLARKCYEIAKRKFGEDNALTEDLESQIATVLASVRKFGQAQEAYRTIIERARRRGKAMTDMVGLYQNYADALFRDAKVEDAEAIESRLLELIEADPWKVDAGLEGRCRMTYGRILAARGKIDDAKRFFETAIARQQLQLGRTHPDTEETLTVYAEMLEYMGAYPESLEVQRELLEIDRRRDREEDWAYVGRGPKIARLLLILGEEEEAVRTMNQAIGRAAFILGEIPREWMVAWNMHLLRGLGSSDKWKSQALRANVWCALEEHLLEVPGGGADLVVERVDWAQLRFRLERWDVSSGTASPTLLPVAQGDLQSLKELAEPVPGIYRLSLDVARPGVKAPQAREAWLVFTEWDVNFYSSGGKEESLETYHEMLAGKPAERRRLNHLLIEHFDSNIGTRRRWRTDYSALSASSSIDLPAGRYRFSATSGGARVYIDQRLVIDSWVYRYSSRDDAVLEIAAGSHQLRVEFYNRGWGGLVWLQVAPAPDAPISSLPVVGSDSRSRRIPPFNPATIEAEFAAKIQRRPFAAQPLFERARLLATWGHFTEAARDYADGLKLDPADHFAWSASAALSLQNGDVEGYRRQCAQMLTRFSATTDQNTCMGTVMICAAMPDAVPDLKTLLELAERAVAPEETDNLNILGWRALAKGMAEYRAGHFAVAVEWLRKAIKLHAYYGAADREVIALYFIAMAESKLGHGAEAEAAFAKATAIVNTYYGPKGGGLGKWFKDKIVALQARKEAAMLLGQPLDPPAKTGK